LSLINDSQGLPLPSFITFTDNGDGTGHITVAPLPGQRGDYTVILVATDAADARGPSLTNEQTFVISATSLSEPPVWAPVADLVAPIGQTVIVPLTVSEVDQDPLTYSVSGFAGASILPGTVYGQPSLQIVTTAGDTGDHTLVLTATNSGNNGATAPLSTSVSILLRVRANDTAPVLAPIGDKTATEGTPFTLQLVAKDAEGDSISYQATGLPRGASLNLKTGLVTWLPDYTQSGRYVVTFSATDGQLANSETINLDVANTPRAPVFVPTGDQVAREGTEATFTVQAISPDGDPAWRRGAAARRHVRRRDGRVRLVHRL
jgi:hypothetical protein